MYATLHTSRKGAVEYLTLNRPDVRNAFNEVMIAELTTWAGSIADVRSVRAVLAVQVLAGC